MEGVLNEKTPVLEVLVSARNYRLREARFENRLTQKQAAECIGISLQKLSEYERLRANYSQEIASKIANFYERPIEYFFPDVIKLATERNAGMTRSYTLSQLELASIQMEMLGYDVKRPDVVIEEYELQKGLKKAIDSLPPGEAEVINLHFGLDNSPPMTFEEIGATRGVGSERARQILNEALQRLRHPCRAKPLKLLLEPSKSF